MIIRLLVLCILLAACGRPLTPGERQFAQDLHGGQVDTKRVRFVNWIPAGPITFERPVRPRVTCQERLFPPQEAKTVTVQPGAMVLFNRVFYRKDLYLEDYLRGHPDRANLLALMLFAHEMTHVWQWQNRDITGYHPLRAASEHLRHADPYLFDVNTKARFLDFGYEQQASIVEEYVCCRALDKAAPRTARLHALISQNMPLAPLDRNILGNAIVLPWAGAEVKNICR